MPKQISKAEYISRLISTHAGRYDYTLLPNSLTTNTRVPIVCKDHGVFYQTLGSHLQGTGCPECNWADKKKRTLTKLLTQAREIHGDQYDYSKTTYTDRNAPSVITCKKHGDFMMRLWSHVTGPDKCPLCGSGKKRTTDQFITLAREVHGDRYDYSEANYTNATTKTTIICSVHGPFQQTPDMHCFSDSQGCPQCKSSKGEQRIYQTLKQMGVEDFVCEKTFKGCTNPSTGNQLRYDFWLPSHNLLIEYDGHAHFHPVNFSGQLSESVVTDRLKLTQQLDQIKTTFAETHGIRILRIPYTEFENISQLIRATLT